MTIGGSSGTPATASATISTSGVVIGFTGVTEIGDVTAIAVDTPGDGYLTKGMKKFVDDLPLTCTPGDATNNCPTGAGAKFIPNAVPHETTYDGVKADEYVIGLVQYRTSFSSEIPEGTLVRGESKSFASILVEGIPSRPTGWPRPL